MPWSRYFAASEDPGSPPPSWPVRALNFGLVVLALSLLCNFSFEHLGYHPRWSSLYQYRALFWQGWLTTIALSSAALVLSVLIGLLSALARRSRFLALRYLARIYVELIRGTPLLVQIMFLFYVLFYAVHLNDPFVSGVLILSLFSGAYISEIIRAGIESVGKSQLESARAIGLTRVQTYRYIIFPQALRQTLPPLAGQFASLIKDSSLLSIVGIEELTLKSRDFSSATFASLETYLPLAAGYLILTLPISLWTRWLEKRHSYET